MFKTINKITYFETERVDKMNGIKIIKQLFYFKIYRHINCSINIINKRSFFRLIA